MEMECLVLYRWRGRHSLEYAVCRDADDTGAAVHASRGGLRGVWPLGAPKTYVTLNI